LSDSPGNLEVPLLPSIHKNKDEIILMKVFYRYFTHNKKIAGPISN